MKTLWQYLRHHRRVIVFLALATGVFTVLLTLYGAPMDALWYAAALTAALGLAMFAFGYWRYRDACGRLDTARRSPASLPDVLPPPRDELEEKYQARALALREEGARAIDQAGAERRDMVDYYTLWAHQIKTPIAAMRLLLQEGAPADSDALLAELFRVEQYVDMVLSYLRLDEADSDYLLRAVPLDHVVRAALRKYARLFILKKLSVDFRESGLTVMSDEKWLLLVVEQLLSNALKYTNAGCVRIWAEGYHLSIEDTGIAIRPEDVPRVFEKGFTGFNGREDMKATGIGLYLCRKVCGKLGHGISIASELGRGTRVTLDLTPGARVVE